MGRGEEECGGRQRRAILCDAFEAFVGALYLEQGLDFTRQYVYKLIEPELEGILSLDTQKDAKSLLQEMAQSRYQLTPTYRTIKEEGPDHAKEFTVEALIGDKAYGRGRGFSKQTAAQAAAQQALATLEREVIDANVATKPDK